MYFCQLLNVEEVGKKEKKERVVIWLRSGCDGAFSSNEYFVVADLRWNPNPTQVVNPRMLHRHGRAGHACQDHLEPHQ